MSELRQRMTECLQLNTLPPSPSVVSDSATTNAAKKLVHLRVVARAAREEAVPVILNKEEVLQILSRLRLPRYQVCLTTIYSCGLLLLEGTNLQVSDIDSTRRMIHLRTVRVWS
jgi:integrase